VDTFHLLEEDLMPCGPRARLTAYVAYETLAFTELQVLLAALTDRGISRVERAPAGTEASSPIPVLDQDRVISGRGALVIRREHLSLGLGDIGFELRDGAYVPLAQPGNRSKAFLEELRTAYGRAKASQLAEQARHRFQGSVHRVTAVDGTVTIRVRF
jgi:hypothetical protein